MRGKVGLVIGLAAGYVLGTRAGRERYAQIKEQAARVWELDAVQHQVDHAKDLTTSAALAVPRAAWHVVVKTVSGSHTPPDAATSAASASADADGADGGR